MLVVYGKPKCSGCEQVKSMLDNSCIKYDYVDVMEDVSAMEHLLSKGLRSLPQVFDHDVITGETFIGGVAEVRQYILDNM